MKEKNVEVDYTSYTVSAIFIAASMVLFFSHIIDITSHLNDAYDSFSNSSKVILVWRLICFSIGVSAIIYMFTCGPGNMRVVTQKKNEEITTHPVGIAKFVTFSSWTLLVNVIYFGVASLIQIFDIFELTIPEILSQIQVLAFCIGISIAFLTATVVKYIILPDEVRIGREHSHMFLFHEQIMHNFAAIFLAIELIITQPNLVYEFAILGLLFGLVYLTFAYYFAYFGGGYFVYSFLHPKPKTAPFFVIGLAISIAIFYLGIWLISTLDQLLSCALIATWLVLIVQFKPK